MNIKFIKEILTSKFNYYLVSKEGVRNGYRKHPDRVILIVIPNSILQVKWRLEREEKSVDSLTLGELEIINNTMIEGNVYLTDLFAPFQHGLEIKNIDKYHGFDEDIREFMVEALALNGKGTYWDFRKLIKDE